MRAPGKPGGRFAGRSPAGWAHSRSLLSETHTYIGFENYTALFADTYFWNALWNTLQILVLSTVPQLIMAVVLAHVLNTRLRGSTFWRMSALLPNITSVVAVTIIFGQLFGRDYGLINWILELFGAGKINWQSGEATSQIAISQSTHRTMVTGFE